MYAHYGLYPGGGTVFSITRNGTDKVLHSFGNGTDGNVPAAPLLDVNGTLYGTTNTGGAYACDGGYCGTVFSITPGGVEKVLYSFGRSGADGAFPFAGLINVKGTLYGTTEDGGTHGLGTVFSITPDGTENMLYSFSGGSDGNSPFAPLTEVNGTLYGTTEGGGSFGTGTVFSITTGGLEKVLHSFGKGTDGAYPYAGITDVHGTLYGTTWGGGSHSSCGDRYGGCGTVFSVTPRGTEALLHRFAGGSDGAYPQAALTEVNGRLYGTTAAGGGASGCAHGCGTIFSISTSGAETVLHSFSKFSDGRVPLAALLHVNGTLYGTTVRGGMRSGNCARGCGTVFSFVP